MMIRITYEGTNFQQIIDQTPRVNQEFKMLGGTLVPTACFYETKATSLGFTSVFVVSEEDTIMESAENRPIDTYHSKLGQFRDGYDEGLKRVMLSMRRLAQQIWSSSRITSIVSTQNLPGPTDSEGIRVLALDGGGVRGLFTIIVLEHLMEEVRKIDFHSVHDALKPCDYFDIIAGTSTGGLLAVMLGRLRMNIKECKRAYRTLSRLIFRRAWNIPGKQWVDAFRGVPWFSAEALESAVKEVIRDEISMKEKHELRRLDILTQDAPLQSTYAGNSKCFVCAIVDQKNECDRLRSYPPRNSQSGIAGRECNIWQACRATSAAPLYFPPMIIGGRKYFDGGMESNNPIIEAKEEAYLEYPERPFAAIVSIGTGRGERLAPSGGVLSIVNSMVSRLTDTEAKHEEFWKNNEELREVYFRLNGPDRLGKIDLAEWERLDEIERLAEEYIDSTVGRLEIGKCAQKLARNNGTQVTAEQPGLQVEIEEQ